MSDEQKKLLITLALAVGACILLLIVTESVNRESFWKELDDWRATNRFAEFLEWERRQGDDKPEPEPGA